jgi:perosamine synthetase
VIPYCQHRIRDEDREAVSKVLGSDRLTQGPMVAAFESGLRAATGARRAVAVSSGTSALQLALQALGVGPGDEVLVPSLTFLATANAVLLAGARPVFVDVDPRTLMLDPDDLSRRVSPRTRGAIVVHYAGHVADLAALRERLGADRFLLEDACHALGAVDHGRPVGSTSEVACFSFHPAKHITTGEGGAIVTRDERLADRCLRLREHGMERVPASFLGLGLPGAVRAEESGGWVYEMQSLSGNHRLPDFASALGLSQLSRLGENLAGRRRIAARYVERLAGDDRIDFVREGPETLSAWHLFPILLDVDRLEGGRAAVYAALHAEGIGVQVHYIPIHLQPYYRERLGTRFGDLPNTEAAYLRLLSLPMFPDLEEAAQERVVEVLKRTLDRLGRR